MTAPPAGTRVGPWDRLRSTPTPSTRFEAAGWEDRAAGYDRFFGSITGRVVEPLLDAASVGPGMRVLDVASGPGYVSGRGGRARRLGGRDRRRERDDRAGPRAAAVLDFRQADAHALPFEAAAFDAVLGNFVILHLGRPEQAVAEFARVLAPGGTVALTVWDLPERARFIGVFLDAVAEAGATPPPDLPRGPDFFRFAVDEHFDELLGQAGLQERAWRRSPSPTAWRRPTSSGTGSSAGPCAPRR